MKNKTVSVIGIGRVGLPLCLILADAGYRVFGVDVRPDYVEEVSRGRMPFLEAGAQPLLRKHVQKRFFPTTDLERVRESDYVVLTLGTPVDEHLNPDYRQIDSVVRDLSSRLRRGQLIVLRSTVAPQTTEYLKEILERATGMKCGRDFFLAFCPERIAQGKAIEETTGIPQIVGGVDPASTKRAAAFFKTFTDEQLQTDARSAELAKIFTNMYRYINFSIANEFLVLAQEHGRRIHEIVHLVNHHYARGGLKLPGYAAGPCLYKDGFFLINALPFNELISVSWKINETLPLYLLRKMNDRMPLRNKKVVILGMAFKADNDDTRNSLSFKIKKALEKELARVHCHDPFVKPFNKMSPEKVLAGADAVVVAMNHSAYKNISLQKLRRLVKKNCLVCDVWNVFGVPQTIYSLDELK